MKTIAVIGAGISGLVAAALLSRRHRVDLFEQERRLGGHTHTVLVDGPNGLVPLDTGFLVHNDRTYPNLVRLFGELGVATRDSDMSLAVSCRHSGLEYSSRGANGFLAQRRNLIRPSHLFLLREIVRFNREAPALLEAPDADRQTLGDFLESRRFSEGFTHRYLFPMAAAIWSASLDVPPTVTYHLNRLQGLTTPEQYCVTLNPDGGIDEGRVLRRLVYRHPLYTREAIHAQRLWGDVSGVNRTHYCGAYWRHGFHEDGLYSALRVARALGVEW